MSCNEFPKPSLNNEQPESMDVQLFLERYRNKMKPNQIELLEHFSKTIYGFKLESMDESFGSSDRNKYKAVFIFIHDGVKGDIKLEF